jgi:4-hydroxy-tetrahydrodipicolinate synthase
VSRFAGVIPPIVTPLDDDGAVDAASLEAVVERQLAAGVDGLFALGSSGEGAYLRDEDRRIVVDVVVGATAGAVPVLAGAVDTTANRVVDQIRRLEGTGVAGVVVTAPFYANVTPRETLAHFRAVASASSLPVLAYDIPGNVGRKLEAQTAIELLAEGTVVGLKDSSGDTAQFLQVLEALGPDRRVSILTGADTGALAALDAGADGVVPGIGNVDPRLFVELVRAVAVGDRATAEELQERISALTEVFRIGERHGIGRHASELGGMKTALQLAGVIAGAGVSIPMSPYPEAARAELAALLAGLRR